MGITVSNSGFELQGQLLSIFSDVALLTGDDICKRAARDIVEYLEENLSQKVCIYPVCSVNWAHFPCRHLWNESFSNCRTVVFGRQRTRIRMQSKEHNTRRKVRIIVERRNHKLVVSLRIESTKDAPFQAPFACGKKRKWRMYCTEKLFVFCTCFRCFS